MAETCKICGLPKDICVCVSISKEETKIKVYLDKRRFKKFMTLVEGIGKDAHPEKIAKLLKSKLACGGTLKEGRIELQGNHLNKIKKILVENGFDEKNIEAG